MQHGTRMGKAMLGEEGCRPEWRRSVTKLCLMPTRDSRIWSRGWVLDRNQGNWSSQGVDSMLEEEEMNVGSLYSLLISSQN